MNDYSKRWNARCYACDSNPVHHERDTYYTYCKPCLKRMELGPYVRRINPTPEPEPKLRHLTGNGLLEDLRTSQITMGKIIRSEGHE